MNRGTKFLYLVIAIAVILTAVAVLIYLSLKTERDIMSPEVVEQLEEETTAKHINTIPDEEFNEIIDSLSAPQN